MAAAESILAPPLPNRPPRAPSTKDLDAAEADLEWWYACAAAELGVSGSGFEGGAKVWDDVSILSLIRAKFRPRVVRAVRKFERIAPVVAAIGPAQRVVASAIYSPRRYVFGYAFPVEAGRPGLCTLAGAALLTPALRAAYARGHGGNLAPSSVHLAEWVETQGQTIAKCPKWVSDALTEARALRLALLVAYVEAARARLRRDYLL